MWQSGSNQWGLAWDFQEPDGATWSRHRDGTGWGSHRWRAQRGRRPHGLGLCHGPSVSLLTTSLFGGQPRLPGTVFALSQLYRHKWTCSQRGTLGWGFAAKLCHFTGIPQSPLFGLESYTFTKQLSCLPIHRQVKHCHSCHIALQRLLSSSRGQLSIQLPLNLQDLGKLFSKDAITAPKALRGDLLLRDHVTSAAFDPSWSWSTIPFARQSSFCWRPRTLQYKQPIYLAIILQLYY